MDSCLSDADLYMAEKAMKRLRIEKQRMQKPKVSGILMRIL